MNRADVRSNCSRYHSGSGISESLLRRCLATARTFAGIGDISSLSASDFAGDGTRRQSFRHGEAPEEESIFARFLIKSSLFAIAENRDCSATGILSKASARVQLNRRNRFSVTLRGRGHGGCSKNLSNGRLVFGPDSRPKKPVKKNRIPP